MTPESRNNGARADVHATQKLSKDVPAATNKHATIEEPVCKQTIGKHTTIRALLETVFSVRSALSGSFEKSW
jgi:hypothetical protein